MTNEKQKRIWGIRAGEGGEAHELFIESGMIALADAELGDLTLIEANRESFYSAYRKRHPDETRTGSSGIGGKYFRFIHEVQIGDLVVYPALKDKRVYVGEITGKYLFDAKQRFPHQRLVDWQFIIQKEAFSISARNELGAARTFFEFKKNAPELMRKINSVRANAASSKTK